jgi:hypothetical protein
MENKKIYILMGILLFGAYTLSSTILLENPKQAIGFFYSYGNNEKFYWTDPAIYKGLFSYQKGWFVLHAYDAVCNNWVIFCFIKNNVIFFWPIMVFCHCKCFT